MAQPSFLSSWLVHKIATHISWTLLNYLSFITGELLYRTATFFNRSLPTWPRHCPCEQAQALLPSTGIVLVSRTPGWHLSMKGAIVMACPHPKLDHQHKPLEPRTVPRACHSFLSCDWPRSASPCHVPHELRLANFYNSTFIAGNRTALRKQTP